MAPRISSGGGLPRGFDMSGAGTVTPLAVDAVGKFGGEYGGALHCRVTFRKRGIGVVAEHAAVGSGTAETGMRGPVIAWTHTPVASFFGIPADGQFDQLVISGAVEVGSAMVAGTDRVVYGNFS